MITNISALYDYFLQQVAAESYLEGVSLSSPSAVRDRLILGTNRVGFADGPADLNQGYPGLTRLTSSQADEFLGKFTIIHQWSDDPTSSVRPGAEGVASKPQLNGDILANTGLSATLIQKRNPDGSLTNEFTLAIRSTEYRPWARGGDGERDTVATDFKSLTSNGFALAQLDALEQYFQWLKDNALLPVGATLDVAGYSLGGHLATVFTEIHQNDSDISFGQTVTFNGAGRGTWKTSAGSLADMLAYYHDVLIRPDDAPIPKTDTGGTLTIQRAAAIAREGQPFDTKFVFSDPRYTWAVTATQMRFGLTTQPLSDESRTGTSADSRITQVFGFETVNNSNFTANSGIHGPALRVGIESQPAIEGLFADYGNGHAITLIGDSLALQRALSQLDPTYSLDRFISLLPVATNRKPISGPGASYEADALEILLDSLRSMILGPESAASPFKEGASGFGDWASRDVFQRNLKELAADTAFAAIAGRVTVVSIAAVPDLAAKARTDFASLLALQTLSPVVLLSKNDADASAVHDALATNWGSISANWLNDSNGYPATFTDQWMKDRANFLKALVRYNIANATGNVISAGGATLEAKNVYVDVAMDRTLIETNNGSLPARFIKFGGTSDDSLLGESLGDELFGGGGADQLSGQMGNDYLQADEGDDYLTGGDGNDTLAGGAGTDSYAMSGAWGKDFLVDSDGAGRILLNDWRLIGGGAAGLSGSDEWQEQLPNGQIVSYRLVDSSGSSTGKDLVVAIKGDIANTITIRNFDADAAKNGTYLGIHLDNTPGLALVQGSGPSFWGDVKAKVEDLAGRATTLVEGAATSYTLFLKTAAKAAETFVLHLTGFNGEPIKGVFGDRVIDADGAVITLAEGQTQVSFALLQDGGLDADVSGNLSVTYLAQDGTSTVSNSWGLNLQNGEDATNTVDGDFIKQTDGAGHYVLRSDGNYTVDPNNVAPISNPDLINGSATADELKGLGDNDALIGLAGDDSIDGGDGDDILQGGLGADSIDGGTGNDTIYGSSTGSLSMPTNEGSHVASGPGIITAGFNWAVTSAGGTDEWGNADHIITTTIGIDEQFGDAGNVIDAGDGDDYVYAGTGDDRVNAGAGKDIVRGMGGADVLLGEDGDDFIAGDGPVAVNGFALTPADQHGQDFLDGGAGNDTLYGEGNNDVVYGGIGDDVLWGDEANLAYTPIAIAGDDYLDGEDGADTLVGQAKNDTLYGGQGNDQLWGDGGGAMPTDPNYLPTSANGNDYLDGEDGDDSLLGQGGDDTIYGGLGADLVDGDDDPTRIAGNPHGSDYLDGEEGADTVIGGGGSDTLYGGAGNDSLEGDRSNLDGQFHGDDYIDGEDGDDTIMGGGGADTAYGGIGADLLVGDRTNLGAQFHGDDSLDGEEGTDTLAGLGGADTLYGGADNDVLFGDGTSVDAADFDAQYAGADYLDGEDGDDQLIGGADDDTLFGGAGNDVLFGDKNGASGDAEGDDYLDGEDGDDQLVGAGGNDALLGGAGNDALWGDAGDDELDGGDGNDSLVGGDGDDTMAGGEGTNTFFIEAGKTGHIVIDSTSATDVIVLGVDIGSIEGMQQSGGLVLKLADGQTITVSGAPTFQFADGTLRSTSQMADYVQLHPMPIVTNLTGADGNAAGSSVVRSDASGSITTIFAGADGAGAKLSDTWWRADGSSGSDTFYADGSSTGSIAYADGTTNPVTEHCRTPRRPCGRAWTSRNRTRFWLGPFLVKARGPRSSASRFGSVIE